MSLASIDLPIKGAQRFGATSLYRSEITSDFSPTVAKTLPPNTCRPALSDAAERAVFAALTSIRVRANLENGLAAATDRNRIRAGVLADIEALLDFALTADQLRLAIAAQLAKLPAALREIDAQYHQRNSLIFSSGWGVVGSPLVKEDTQ